MATKKIVSSRTALHELMEKTINKNLRSMEEREEYAEYAVKTNIIESNCGLEEIPKNFLGYSIEIRSTVDKYLYVIIVKSNNKNFTLYLDTMNKRFWKIHNIEKSETVDAFLNQFSNQLHKIDTLWMPHQMIGNLEKDYINVGFSSELPYPKG